MSTMNNGNASFTSNGSTFQGENDVLVLIPTMIQITFSSLTILLALAYSALIFIRLTFRQNKLNWFIVNICLQSGLFSLITISLVAPQLLNISSDLPCRIQGYLIIPAVCQVLYSHCVASFCRFLAIVYATKHLFRSSAFTRACLACGWLISVLIPGPYLFLDGFGCPSQSQVPFLSYYTTTMTLVLPMAIMAMCNWRIFLFARRSTRQVQPSLTNRKGTDARDIQLMKTLIGTFVIMVIGWLPIFILQASTLLDVCLLIYTNQPVRLILKQRVLRRAAPVNPPNTNRN